MDTLRSLLTSVAKFLAEAESCIAQVKSLCKQPQKLEKDVQLLTAAVKKYDELKSESNHYKALVLEVLGKMSVAAGCTEYNHYGRYLHLYLNEPGSVLISYRGQQPVTVRGFVESSSDTEEICTLIVRGLSGSLADMARERKLNAECIEKLSLLVTQLMKDKKSGMEPERPSQ